MQTAVFTLCAALTVTLVTSDIRHHNATSGDYRNHDEACYDCNYAPSGYVKGYEDWRHGSAEVGYMRCALVSRLDEFFVHKNPCRSGRCYIRREENGMVYRGCADYENLPWDVNTDVNCKYQGPGKSLWYFCDGHACNHGQLGDTEERCGSPPAQQPEEVHQEEVDTDTPSYEQYPPYGKPRQVGWPRGSWGGRLVALKLFPLRWYEQPKHQVDPAHPSPPAATRAPSTPRLEYNPCDGLCHYNPSGLFADEDRPDHFIQCGCDFRAGRPCTCCQKFYLSCDPNTYFDDSKKVCVRPDQPY